MEHRNLQEQTMAIFICKDTIEYIMKTVDFLRKVKYIRPIIEKIYNWIRKELIDELNIVKHKINVDYLIDNGIVEVRVKGEQELVFIVEGTDGTLEKLGEQTIPETNIQTEIQMALKGNVRNPPRVLDVKPKIRSKLFKKSASCKGLFFRRRSYVYSQTTKWSLSEKSQHFCWSVQ